MTACWRKILQSRCCLMSSWLPLTASSSSRVPALSAAPGITVISFKFSIFISDSQHCSAATLTFRIQITATKRCTCLSCWWQHWFPVVIYYAALWLQASTSAGFVFLTRTTSWKVCWRTTCSFSWQRTQRRSMRRRTKVSFAEFGLSLFFTVTLQQKCKSYTVRLRTHS